MRRNKLLLSAAAAAVLAAFNPAFAQDSTSPKNIDSGEQNVWSGVSANQSSTDIASSSSVDQSASTSQSSTTESPVSRDSAPQAPASTDNAARGSAAPADGNASSGASVSSGRGSEDKATGLDRADQAAGEHGKHGRDNARAKQSGG